jgi:hypothetical protein
VLALSFHSTFQHKMRLSQFALIEFALVDFIEEQSVACQKADSGSKEIDGYSAKG